MSGIQGIILPALGSKAEFEEKILEEASTKKLVMGIGSMFQDNELNIAFQKALETGWVRLWDLQPVLTNPMAVPGPSNPPLLCRIFKITNSGQDRLQEIRRKKQIDQRLKSNKQ